MESNGLYVTYINLQYYPPASEASKEVANLTERKNPHTPIWCQRICLSVCLSITHFDLNSLRTGEIEWAEIFLGMSLSRINQQYYCCWAQAPKSVCEFVMWSLWNIVIVNQWKISQHYLRCLSYLEMVAFNSKNYLQIKIMTLLNWSYYVNPIMMCNHFIY